MRWLPYLAAFLVFITVNKALAADDNVLAVSLPQRPGAYVGVKGLSPAAEAVAKILGVESTITRIRELSKDDGQRAAAVTARQQLLIIIIRTLLEERTVLSEIDTEMAASDEGREKIDTARDRSVTMNNILNLFLSGSLNVTGNCLQFGNNSVPGNVIGVAAGAVNILLSGRALARERGPRPLVGKQEINLLAKPLGFSVDNTDKDYPSTIWAYLNSPVPGDGKTRLEDLIKRWQMENDFVGDRSQRTARLAGVATDFHLTSELLDTRRDMLNQLRNEVSKIEYELLELLKFTEQ